MNCVLDACAMIAYLRGEEGADAVSSLLVDPAVICYAHAINLCEVYYDFVRTADLKTARSALRDLSSVGIRNRNDMNAMFWRRAGELKGTIRKVSFADCFAIAISEVLDAEIITSDHHEFDALVRNGVCRARFIR